MLSYIHILERSIVITAILLLVDTLAVTILNGIVKPLEIFGDLLLLETAALFLIAGMIDLASSIGTIVLRKSFLSSKEVYSADKRKRSERRALPMVGSGLMLLFVVLLLFVYTR